MTDQNQIVAVIEQSDLPKPKVQALMEVFAPAFQEARGLVELAKDIKVTDENDIETMQLAREKRLALKEIRVTVEKTRKELKEQSLREGRAIDGAANIIKALIVPVEEHLEQQEKFAELLEEKRLNERYQNRLNLLAPYVSDTSLYKLKEMSDAAFDNLLTDCKTAHEQKIAAEQKAEAERLELERKQKVFNDRKFELVKYSDFVEIAELTIDSTQEQFEKLKQQALAGYEKHKAAQEELRKQAEADRIAKEKAEAALKAQQEAQAKKEADERAKLVAEQQAKEKAERDEMLAPDRVKLLKFATLEGLTLPAVKSNEAQKIVNEAEKRLHELSNWIAQEAKKL